MEVAGTRPTGHADEAESVADRDALAFDERLDDLADVSKVVPHTVVAEEGDRLAAARRRVVDRGDPVVDASNVQDRRKRATEKEDLRC